MTQKQKGLDLRPKGEGLSTFARRAYLRHLFAAFKGNFKPLTQKQYIQLLNVFN